MCPYNFWWRCKLVKSFWRAIWPLSLKLEVIISFDPEIQYLGNYFLDILYEVIHLNTECNTKTLLTTYVSVSRGLTINTVYPFSCYKCVLGWDVCIDMEILLWCISEQNKQATKWSLRLPWCEFTNKIINVVLCSFYLER